MANSLRLFNFTPLKPLHLKPNSFTTLCSPSPPPPTTPPTNPPTKSDSDPTFETPLDSLSTTNPSFSIEKRVPSSIRARTGSLIAPHDPPNFQIGWKRTKEIKTEKPKGWPIADLIEKLGGLMERGRFGSPALLAKTVGIVAERAREEAEVLRAREDVDERVLTELMRVLRLVELDAEMVKAAVKEETLKERVENAKARCRQAILVAMSL